ncbi:hypothetical protein NA57DRAFT_75238 [Rhizodiscina lignyota]|uniref:DNA replication checkpoint mediator MRC1 domain-containing protein n=1 Tax=Rhizodiscina lignyota TaxID=1504668 RepID=A0A9P4IF09_9PEZI|nr:hypothetical protein NA57DRAFT_75238 [Rhizodiscina lignyota]
MSTPSTPSRAGSASRVSSPAHDRKESPIELTPRSKIRAILARVDEDSDDDPMPITHLPADDEATRPAKQAPTSVRFDAQKDLIDDDSEDSEDDIPVRARGGLAGRMTASTITKSRTADKGEDSAQSAYARIKKQLLGSMESEGTEQTAKPQVANADPSDASDDESHAPQPRIGRRKLLHRRRADSPSSPRPNRSARSSPGLFVSPAKSTTGAEKRTRDDTDSDSGSDSLPDDPLRDEKILASVAKKRAERQAAEKAAKARKQASSDPISVAESDSNDEDAADVRAKFTQESRPTRKASKKALLEMQRETQRMSRNMQLEHQEKTRKRYSTKDLFQKFNFRKNIATAEQQEKPRQDNAQTDNDDTSALEGGLGLGASSEAEGIVNGEAETPPTSPPADYGELLRKSSSLATEQTRPQASFTDDEDNDLPDMAKLLSEPVKKVNKGKGRAIEPDPARIPQSLPRTFKINLSGIQEGADVELDSDDDMDDAARPKTKSRLPVFDKLPAQKAKESHSLLVQRALAHLTSPGRAPTGKRNGKPTMTTAQMQAHLLQRARQQALQEKQNRIEQLRARGVVVLTEEEREQEQMQLENMLEKAREEARLLAKKEKKARENGEEYRGEGDIDMLSSEEDGEWEGDEDGDADESGGEEDEPEGLELSGSEEDEEEEGEEEGRAPNPLFDDQADEDEGEDEEDIVDAKPTGAHEENSDGDTSVHDAVHRQASRPKPRHRQIIDDDDDDESQTPSKQHATAQPSQNDEMAAFGFAKMDTSPVTFTQMFAGSMADLDSQTQADTWDTQAERNAAMNTEYDSLAFLKQLPPATLPDFQAEMPATQIEDSQTQASATQDADTPLIKLGLSQFESQQQSTLSPSRFSEMPDPTQDAGFAMSQTMPQAPHSTVETVVIPVPETPVAEKRRARLHQRRREATVMSDPDEEEWAFSDANGRTEEHPVVEDPVQAQMDAFTMLRKAAKKKAKKDAFDKKKSEAKGMVDEQAEESEDEYAGLGGASDDESTGEVDEEVQKMMDDSHVEVDERKIAAFYADKAKVDNEKAVNKLFNDLTTGALRRRHGDGLDLSDNDDDDLAERRRRKQREFARRTKALLEDEKIGKIAENPKKQAFFHALEDRDYDEDVDFLDAPPDQASNTITDSQTDPPAPEATQDVTMAGALEPAAIPSTNPQKRKASEMTGSMAHRRSDPSKRARNLSEVQESLSFLIDEPESIPDSQLSDQDSEGEHDQMRPPPLRRDSPSSRPVVNRLSLASLTDSALNSASNNGNAHTNGVNMAFQTSENAAPIFKVPTLLRRATNLSTTSSTTSTSNSGRTTPTGVEIAGVKRGGSKKSNIHYQAREAERRKLVEEAERRRKEGMRKKITGRGLSGSVLGRLAAGKGSGGFE